MSMYIRRITCRKTVMHNAELVEFLGFQLLVFCNFAVTVGLLETVPLYQEKKESRHKRYWQPATRKIPPLCKYQSFCERRCLY